MRIDVICPVYWINNSFLRNVVSWQTELPFRKIFLGINNSKLPMDSVNPSIEVIDQTHLRTLGACLVDLMKRVETEWFAFIHADVWVIPESFKRMNNIIDKNMGIMESEHIHLEDGVPKYYNYFKESRAYSGFQLIRKKAIESILDKIEDDYVYRNEDLIFQNVCNANGYGYAKTRIKHLHQVSKNGKNTFSEKEIHDMQWKGLVKYSPLQNNFMTKLIIGSIKHNVINFNLKKETVVKFINKNNPMWINVIEKIVWRKRGDKN